MAGAVIGVGGVIAGVAGVAGDLVVADEPVMAVPVDVPVADLSVFIGVIAVVFGVAIVGGRVPRIGAGAVTSRVGVTLLPTGAPNTDLLMWLGNGLVIIGADVLPAVDGVTIGTCGEELGVDDVGAGVAGRVGPLTIGAGRAVASELPPRIGTSGRAAPPAVGAPEVGAAGASVGT